MKIIILVLNFLIVTISNSYIIDNNWHLKCDANDMRDSASAYYRSKTEECKHKIENAACYFKVLKSLDYTHQYKRLNTQCSSIHKLKTYQPIGCLNSLDELKNLTKYFNNDVGLYNQEVCIDYCTTYHSYFYAVYPNQFNCICVKNLTISNTNTTDCKLPIYRTGRLDRLKREEKFIPNQNTTEQIEKYNKIILDEQNSTNKSLPRIVFLFTVFMKTDRQLFRLLKTLYDPYHFYYFHVDERSIYLRKKLETTFAKLKKPNIKLTKWSMKPIWGGSSLTFLHLRAMKDLLELKETKDWNWDYVLNLSEADFPLKSVQELTLFMSQHNGLSFIGFLDPKENINELIVKQGVNWHFIECENRMWKIAPRKLPIGIQFDGSGDWFCFHFKFVDYMINSKDELMTYLLRFFEHTLMGPETFYHTVFMNSPLCNDYINMPLRISNFKKEDKRSCHCNQIVDWCGCSPPYYKYNELELKNFKRFEQWPLFLARKFDPIHNQKMINFVDESIFGKYREDFESLDSYWMNFFDNEIEPFQKLDYKYQLVFGYFSKISVEFIEAQPLKNHFIFDLKSVESFFSKNEFEGFVLNFNVVNPNDGNFLTKTETFIKPEYNHLLETSFDGSKYSWSNSTFCHYAHYNSFFRHFIRIEVSSDIDAKELRGKNYARILNELDNPVLIIYFGHLIYSKLNFLIRWHNPKGIVIRSSYWTLMNGFYPYEQFAYQFLGLGKPVDVGEWEVTITAFNLLPEMNVFKEEDILVRYKFLVLPAENVKQIIDDHSIHLFDKHQRLSNILNRIGFNNYWSINSTCIMNNVFLKRGSFIEKCKNSYWSTYFPDPKSDLFSSVSLNLNDRIKN